MSPREAFLARVRQAVADGNQAGAAPPLPERAGIGYQGGGPDLADRFCTELAAAGGKGHIASDRDAACRAMQSILSSHAARKVLLSGGGLVGTLDIAGWLRQTGMDVMITDELAAPDPREGFFAADIGISNVHRLIAETGTVVVVSQRQEARSVSLLPPVHIALAGRSQLLPDLFDLFDLFSPDSTPPPSCLSLITGPSKTGDIELRLVTGVHGPGEVHVILCPWA